MSGVHPGIETIRVRSADCAEEIEAARRLIRDRGLPELFARIDPGVYGFTRQGLEALSHLERSLALAAEVAKRLRRLITASDAGGEGFVRPRPLEPEERLFVGLFATYAAAVEGGEAMAALAAERVRVENRFSLLQTKDLVAGPLDALPRRLVDDLAAYVDHHRRARSELRVDSAASLVRCLTAYFRLLAATVAEFDGVVGLYWGDIDTAFAARDDRRIRLEEKSILAASFGIFDGTLLPKDGRWFMMADANVMNMDPATISRITQDPFLLAGAETAADVIRLLRDVKLRRHRPQLSIDAAGWARIGELCLAAGLSGRAIDNVARRAIVEIEDFEYPDEYFAAPLEHRREIIAERSRPLDADGLRRIVERYAEFERQAEERAGRERFERRVEEIVLNLGAERAAVARTLGDQGAP